MKAINTTRRIKGGHEEHLFTIKVTLGELATIRKALAQVFFQNGWRNELAAEVQRASKRMLDACKVDKKHTSPDQYNERNYPNDSHA